MPEQRAIYIYPDPLPGRRYSFIGTVAGHFGICAIYLLYWPVVTYVEYCYVEKWLEYCENIIIFLVKL